MVVDVCVAINDIDIGFFQWYLSNSSWGVKTMYSNKDKSHSEKKWS